MIQIICFFCPAVLAVELLEAKQNRKLSVREFITTYIIFVGIINFICLSVVALIFHHPDYIINQNIFSIGFAFKYLLLSFLLAVVLPIFYEKSRKNIVKYLEGLVEKGRRKNDTTYLLFDTAIY